MNDQISPAVIDVSEWTKFDISLTACATNIYALYAWAVDNGDFNLLRSIVAPDIRITRNGMEHAGLDAFLGIYRNNWESDWSAAKHYISNVIASEDSDGNIRSRAYFQAVFIRSKLTNMVVGHYDDTLVATDGNLRIAHKRIFIEGSVDLPETSRDSGRFPPLARVK